MCDLVENADEAIMEGEIMRGESWGTSALEKGPGGGDSSFDCSMGGEGEDRCFGGGDVSTGLDMTGWAEGFLGGKEEGRPYINNYQLPA